MSADLRTYDAKMVARLVKCEEMLKELLIDIEAMRCPVPTGDWVEGTKDAKDDSWFGPFTLGDLSSEDYTTSVQWLNLKLTAERAKRYVNVED